MTRWLSSIVLETKTLSVIVSLFVVLVFFTGVQGIGLLVAQQASYPTESLFSSLIEWLRVVGGVIGMIFGIWGIWVYARALGRQKTTEAQSATIKIYEDQTKAQTMRISELTTQFASTVAAGAEREKELILLKARTDLSHVLETLTTFMKSSEVRYADGMKVLNGMLDHLNANAKEGLSATATNYELLKKMVTSIDALSRRFGAVEESVEATRQATQDDGQDRDSKKDERRKGPR